MNLPYRKLPHWARVYFATRCARRVQPLLREHWDGVPDSIVNQLELAISLAEQSATSGCPLNGLSDASANAVCIAGRVQVGLYPQFPFADDGIPTPVGETAVAICAHTARAAGCAAEAAAKQGDESLQAVSEAHGFALAAAMDADEDSINLRLEDDFNSLRGRAKEAGWNERSPIPLDVLPSISNSDFDRLLPEKFWKQVVKRLRRQ